MVLPLLLGTLVVVVLVLVVVLRLRPASEPGRIGIAALLVVLALLTTVALLSSRQPTAPTGSVDATPTATVRAGASANATAAATAPPSGGGTSAPVLLRYEVAVAPGSYRVFRVDAAGSITDETGVSFDGSSWAPVDRVEASNGLVHWRIVVGGLTGSSFVPDRSGPFRIREVLRASDGSLVYEEIPVGG